ncbi:MULTISPECIES: hypothetical protein [Sorangium]|uniref:hypothetical protein n=1 Tax=Sorangium TaxID=39643 RepID=UPI0012FFB481|nr:hypothetical protein [Sorangium cellulosum]
MMDKRCFAFKQNHDRADCHKSARASDDVVTWLHGTWRAAARRQIAAFPATAMKRTHRSTPSRLDRGLRRNVRDLRLGARFASGKETHESAA